MVNQPLEGFRAAVVEYVVREFGNLTPDQIDYILSRVEPRYANLGMTWEQIREFRPTQSLWQEFSVYVRNARKVCPA